MGTNNMTQVGTNHLILAACVSCVSYLPHVSLVSVHLILASCVCACLHAYCIHVCSSLHTCMLISVHGRMLVCMHVCYACTRAHVHACIHKLARKHAKHGSEEGGRGKHPDSDLNHLRLASLESKQPKP